MNEQRHYVGLDVSLETTSICVIDDAGAIIWRGSAVPTPTRLLPPCASMPPAQYGLVWRPDSCPTG